MLKMYSKENTTLVAVALFLIIFCLINTMKPSCFYHKNNSIREFGIGYKNKTILPIWLLSLVLGYLSVLYYAKFA